jgi:streptogramin lyase
LYVVGIALLLSGSIFYAVFFSWFTASCGETLGTANISRVELPSVHFNAVTKFRLPEKVFPNGITVASDGSAWFGEQDPPGIAHLYGNGTMVEYRWSPNYPLSTTSIWGVADWHGRVWVTDAMGGQIVTLDPNASTVSAVRLRNEGAFPYTITLGLDDALWFTELYGSRLGRIDAQCKLTEYRVPTNFGGTPTQVEFVNSTYGYYVDAGNATNGLGEVLAFNTRQFNPQPVGGNFRPQAATSLALAGDGLWVAQHASSNLAYYSFQTHTWTQYPTTPVSYVPSTLPYFVAANGSLLWFNEHYANRIGVIDTERGLLTEYSLSNPPANKTTQIDNALTFAVGKDRVWFTELTANYVGYVNAAYKPPFVLSPSVQNLKLLPGQNVSLSFVVSSSPGESLAIRLADNENFTARPEKIRMSASVIATPRVNQKVLTINIGTDRDLAPGRYVLLVTVSNELINRGVYVQLLITQ